MDVRLQSVPHVVANTEVPNKKIHTPAHSPVKQDESTFMHTFA